ncbi:MAG: SH3 domain-containing protein [Clostridiales bacterium]|jgi:SpoIID/LytB domain protein|nr:SH3 domain-containing protein [Clostridiales bacterium]
MRKLICIILATLLTLAAVPVVAERTAQAADYSTVRVKIGDGGITTLNIAVRGAYFVQETGAAFSDGTLTVKVSGSKVVLSHSKSGELYSGSSVNVMRQTLAPSAGSLSMVTRGVTRSYLGHFKFKYSGGSIMIVNTVPIMHYLYGVVAFEMSNNFPIESLKAQAVAAKCYVLSGMAPGADYDIGDTASDQVYKGYNASYTSVMAAVDATYDVWLFLGNSILCSYFAASNGGQTALPSDIWAGTNRYIWDKAYARVQDPYDIANPLTVQEAAFYPRQGDGGGMSAALSNYLRGRSTRILQESGQIDKNASVVYINSIDAMTQRSNAAADISLTVTVQQADGSAYAMNYSYMEEFSWLVANGVFTRPQLLRLYTLTQTNNGWELRRGRYGHGVGLSQRGAEQMANSGWSYDRILKFYYPGASIKSMGLTMPQDPVNAAGAAGGTDTTQLGAPIGTAVTTGQVNLRAGPSTSTASQGKVGKGVSMNVYAQENGFSLVDPDGKTGYISNAYLKITAYTTATSPGASANTVTAYGRVTSSTLNFRDKASTNGKKLQTLKKNDTLNIYGYADGSGSWYYCNANNMDGYVSAQYVEITGAPATSSTTDTVTADTAGGASGTVTPGLSGTILTEGVFVRKTASTTSARVASLQRGLPITILGEEGDFYHITVSGYTGYVPKSAVAVAASAASGSSGGGATQSGSTTGKVNLRKGPGTKHAKLTQLKKGTALTIHSYSDGWYQVTTSDGKEGYVSGDYVKVNSGATTSSSGTSSSGATTVTTGKVVNEWVRLRSTASLDTQTNIIGDYAVGTTLTIYGQEGSFYRVSTGTQEGYMHKDYVQITGTASVAESAKSGVTTGKVRLRSAANTSDSKNIITTLAKGAKVTINSTSNGWHHVTVNGKTGYVSAQYVRVA